MVSPEAEDPSGAAAGPASATRALDAVTPRTSEQVHALSGHFLGVSLRRAFRLQIQTDEVLPSEHAHLGSQARPIVEPEHRAFLAWRRSVLLLVAIMFVPLTVSRFFEAFEGAPLSPIGRAFSLMPAVSEAAFCVIAFDQLRNWAQWRRQRRILFIAWSLYFVAPFLVYLYPFRTAYDAYGYRAARMMAGLFGIKFNPTPAQVHIAIGLGFGLQALLVLGPKVISLMPGMIRASIVTKLQFPGTSAPGWLMLLAAPLYALFAYIIVLLPYQITGSWQFIVGNIGILGAQVFIGRAGRRLTVPLSAQESHDRIHRSWLVYIGIIVVSAGFMVYGLSEFVHDLNIGALRVITSVLTVISNVLLDTLIGTDAIVSAMAYFRGRGEIAPERLQMLRQAEAKLDVFCG